LKLCRRNPKRQQSLVEDFAKPSKEFANEDEARVVVLELFPKNGALL
jgi:hypothetical protein